MFAYAEDATTLINTSTVWSYYDSEEDPVKEGDRTSWTTAEFDISEWKNSSGKSAKFGAKNGKLKAVDSHNPKILLNQYKTGTEKNIEAFFFRTGFKVKEIPDDYVLTGKLHYDDAALIYLNGKLVAEFDNEQKADSSKKFTANMQYGGHGSSVQTVQFQIKASLLNEGANIIAVEIHQRSKSSSDIYFEMESLKMEPFVPVQKSLTLNVGEDENCRNITWYYNGTKAGRVQYAEKNGSEFPEQYRTAKASVEPTNYGYLYSNKASLTDLEPDTEYVYRVVNEECVSDIYSFKTPSAGDFSFLAVGDPQLGDNEISSDTKKWNNTLSKSLAAFPETAFMLSAGDQVDKCSNESHYDALLENDYIKSLPLATSIGNHDEDSDAYSQHFNNPNIVEYGSSDAGSSYWFVFNDVLFMNMNSNSGTIAQHKAFLKEAIKANPDVKWKIVSFHHSIYSAAYHAEDSGILKRRDTYVPMLEELGIDVVFMGHDHVYVRTHIMKEQSPVAKDKNEHFAVNPDGILYMTMNSSSGSKMYNVKGEYSYAAVQMQEQIPNVTNVEVSDEALKITVHRIDKSMSVADYFVLYNENMVPQDISDYKAKLSYSKCTYNGSSRKPAVTVDGLTADDYDVIYKNNKYPGKATVTIKGKGRCTGSITKHFTIRPAAVKTISLSLLDHDDIRVKWSTVTGADGYRVYYKKDSGSWKYYKTAMTGNTMTVKNCIDGSNYRIKVVPYVVVGDEKVKAGEKISSSITILIKIQTKQFKKVDSKVSVRWNNINGETGYQIARADKKYGKYTIIKTYKTTKGNYYRVTATKNKTYYYKVRAYKMFGDRQVNGPWSAPVKFRR